MPDLSEKEKRLIEFETYFDCRLPEDYRDFLLGYEGAVFERNCLPKHGIWIEPRTPGYVIDLGGDEEPIIFYEGQHSYSFEGPLFWLTEEENTSLFLENKTWRHYFVEDSWFPEGKDYIVFAGDGGSNYFCLGICSPDCGNIYFWSHEEAWGDQEMPIARSFTEFLSMGRTEDEATLPMTNRTPTRSNP